MVPTAMEASVDTVRRRIRLKFDSEFDGRGRHDFAGTMHFVDGRKYIGDFEAGEFHGVGLTIYPNGDFFHGNFRNGEDPAHNSEKCLLCS